MIHHRKCLCLSLEEGWHFTKHHTLVLSLSSCLHSNKNTCSLVHCSSVQEATGYWWFNDITSDDRRSRDPVLLCFMSSRQLGRPHCCYIIRTGRLPNIDYLAPSWWWWKVLTCLHFLAWNNITIIILALAKYAFYSIIRNFKPNSRK